MSNANVTVNVTAPSRLSDVNSNGKRNARAYGRAPASHLHLLTNKEKHTLVYVHLQLAADNARAESGGMNQ